MKRSAFAGGLAVAGVYLVAAVVTLAVSDRPFRPLFDGLAPPVPYRWVNPPSEVARDNRQPVGASRDVVLGPTGNPFVNVTPDDGQAIVLLDDGSVPPHSPDTSLAVVVTPLDVLTLGPLPTNRTPQSNAYRVEVAYRPSGQPATEVRGDTSVIDLVSAGPSDYLLYSPDGRAWAERETQPLGSGHGLETRFAGPGYYVVTAIAGGGGGGSTSPAVVIAVLAVPPLLIGGLVLRSRRARARAEAEKAAAAAARRRAQQKRGGRKSKRPPR